MNNKIIILIALIIIFSLPLEGCIRNDNNSKKNNLDNSAPIAIISAPDTGYFDTTITFDAYDSYDIDGKILSYQWDFRDGSIIEGGKADHIFNFGNDFDIEYPIIYTVLLKVEDDDKNIKIIEHQIKLYPKKYLFYFDFDKLSYDKPFPNENIIGASGKFNINPAQEIIYELQETVKIQKCQWNVTIYIEKPLFTNLEKIIITLYNKTGYEISNGETSFRKFEFWKEKMVIVNGEINNNDEFKSVKLSLYGLSFGKKIRILYGGDSPSNIYFNFVLLDI